MNQEDIKTLANQAGMSHISLIDIGYLEAFVNLILEAAALKCDEQQLEPECPELASYCAESIRSMNV